VSDAASIFRFAQFEFPWALGPDDGRYVVRAPGGGEIEHVLVLTTLGTRERRLLRRRQPHEAEAEPAPTPVATTRATVIATEPFADAAAADAWLAEQRGDREEAELERAMDVLNAVLHAQRVAAADALVREVSLRQALVARLGHGRGEEVAEGRWTSAFELPAEGRPRRQRASALRPQERLAALLGGHDRPLACEELTLRARHDFDRGRIREAALELRVALEAALAELDPADAGMAERIDELRERRGPVADAANAALAGEPSAELAAAVGETLERLAAALRARTAARLSS
jgi:hypothetical protein